MNLQGNIMNPYASNPNVQQQQQQQNPYQMQQFTAGGQMQQMQQMQQWQQQQMAMMQQQHLQQQSGGHGGGYGQNRKQDPDRKWGKPFLKGFTRTPNNYNKIDKQIDGGYLPGTHLHV